MHHAPVLHGAGGSNLVARCAHDLWRRPGAPRRDGYRTRRRDLEPKQKLGRQLIVRLDNPSTETIHYAEYGPLFPCRSRPCSGDFGFPRERRADLRLRVRRVGRESRRKGPWVSPLLRVGQRPRLAPTRRRALPPGALRAPCGFSAPVLGRLSRRPALPLVEVDDPVGLRRCGAAPLLP